MRKMICYFRGHLLYPSWEEWSKQNTNDYQATIDVTCSRCGQVISYYLSFFCVPRDGLGKPWIAQTPSYQEMLGQHISTGGGCGCLVFLFVPGLLVLVYLIGKILA